MAEELPTIKCDNPKCGAVVVKRVSRPVKCSRCGYKYKYKDEKKIE